MDKKRLESVFNAIGPDDELIARTKAKMELAAKTRERAWSSPLLRLAVAACLLLVITSTLLVTNHLGQSTVSVYEGYFTAADEFNLIDGISKDSLLIDQRKELQFPEGLEQQFMDNITEECGFDSRLLTIQGEVISTSTYMAQDSEKYGILGLTMTQVEIKEITYSKNNDNGPRVGDEITVASYIRSFEQLESEALMVSGNYLYYLYTGANNDPGDTTGELIGLRQSWLIYAAFPLD